MHHSTRPRRAITAVCLIAALLGVSGCRLRQRDPQPPSAERLRQSEASRLVVDAQRKRGQGLDDEALRQLLRAIEINPTLTPAYLEIGQIHQERGDYPQAEKVYDRAARLEPRNFDAQYNHGLMLQLLDRVADAIRAYLRALSIRPDDFDANLNLATAYLSLDEPQQALLYGKRAVRLQPESAPARLNLGAIYAALDDHESAIVEYQQAAELMDLTPDLLLSLAQSLGKVGRYAEMVNTLEELIGFEPSAAAHERLGAAYFNMNRMDEALDQFKQAIEMDAQHYPALNGVGICRLNNYLISDKEDRRALDDALRALRRSLQIERNQPRIKELVSRYGAFQG